MLDSTGRTKDRSSRFVDMILHPLSVIIFDVGDRSGWSLLTRRLPGSL
jgi:hypothetical protein